MSVDEPRESRDHMAEMYGPVNAVYLELRTHAPLIVASCKSGLYEAATQALLRVSYQAEPTQTLKWDEEAQFFVWVDGLRDGAQLGREPQRVAARIAETLGAPFSAPPAEESTEDPGL